MKSYRVQMFNEAGRLLCTMRIKASSKARAERDGLRWADDCGAIAHFAVANEAP